MSNIRPPYWAEWLVSGMDEYENNYSIKGDLAEVYQSKVTGIGKKRADRWYRKEAVKSSFSYSRYIFGRNMALIINSFKPALRNLVKFRAYSAINLTGIAVAVSVALMIAFFVRTELKMDSFQKNRDHIYRVESKDWALLGAPHGKLIKEEFAEVENYVTFNNISFGGLYVKKKDDTVISLRRTLWASEDFFKVFDAKFIHGGGEDLLKAPFSIVLTRSDAIRLFGHVDVMGKEVVIKNKYSFKVTGVIEDIKNVHFRTGSVISFNTLPEVIDDKKFMTRLDSWNHATFLKLKPETDVDSLGKKITAFFNNLYLRRHNVKSTNVYSLRNFKDIYFCNEKFHEYSMKHGSSSFLMILTGIAVFIILIACINYINISTSIAGLRAKEIGLRKTVGGSRSSLILQFMLETAIVCSIGFILASVSLYFIMPQFGSMLGTELEFSILDPWALLIMSTVWLVVTLAAGLYPALYLTSFKPSEVLKGRNSVVHKGNLRKVLVVFQFTVSIALSIATLIIFDQISFMRNAETGFSRDQVVTLGLRGELRSKRELIRKELMRIPDVKAVAYCNAIPGYIRWTETFESGGVECEASYNPIDEHYLNLMDLKLIEGRNLVKSDRSEELEGFICNETAMKTLGFKRPWVGKSIDNGYAKKAVIVGVVKDFHIDSLHSKIKPLFMSIRTHGLSTANIKLNGKNVPEVMEKVKKLWKRYAPDYPFRYHFINEAFDNQYRREEKMGNMVGYFALLALFIAGAGLTGLSSFAAMQKRKEVSVRKVLGASVPGVVMLLAADFMKWVLIANIVAWPLVWSGMNKWLSNFAYRTDIDFTLFIYAGTAAFVIAFITVCYHSVKAATENPAEVLKCEN